MTTTFDATFTAQRVFFALPAQMVFFDVQAVATGLGSPAWYCVDDDDWSGATVMVFAADFIYTVAPANVPCFL